MEIKVGEYVRTDNGIDKFLYKAKYDNGADKYVFEKAEMSNPEYYVLKHSNNIIELIEEGDYVDGIKVKEIYFCGEKYEGLGVEKFGKYLLLNEIKFKSIVTHEQFSSLEYII